jgi:hypothetical protein
MRRLANWPWWRIAQVVFAFALLAEVGAPKTQICIVPGIVGPYDVYGATVQSWLEKIEKNTRR